jgi:benzoylsuccinyl-CoA thiolase BbsB subunit
MRKVAVIGIGQTKFGKFPNRSAIDMGREAALAALKDAGVNPKLIQVAYASRLIDSGVIAQHILKGVGIAGIEMVNVQNDCAGGATAFRNVWKDIANGLYDYGIAIGVESMTTMTIAGKMLSPLGDDLEGQLGMTMPAVFALLAHRQMELFGTTLEDFATISVKNHHNACMNPFAYYQKEFTVEDVLKSRMICEPLTVLECCPQTDGAAAAVLCASEMARKHTTRLVTVIGSALLSGEYKYRQRDIAVSDLGLKTARAAYEMAGVGPEDVDLVELHDAFASEEIMRYEDLGLCKPGEGTALLRSGATEIGGRVPVNPSGGLLGLGHPLSASGVRTIAELVLHLRDQAGQRQTPNAKIGLAHMLGGSVTDLEAGACGIHILSR